MAQDSFPLMLPCAFPRISCFSRLKLSLRNQKSTYKLGKLNKKMDRPNNRKTIYPRFLIFLGQKLKIGSFQTFWYRNLVGWPINRKTFGGENWKKIQNQPHP